MLAMHWTIVTRAAYIASSLSQLQHNHQSDKKCFFSPVYNIKAAFLIRVRLDYSSPGGSLCVYSLPASFIPHIYRSPLESFKDLKYI